ncbi:retrovirus-related pol polyprotein from transposon TNT 1-94 [Tanacetum coccineum]
MLCYLTRMELYYIHCFKDGPFQLKTIEGANKHEAQWSNHERRVVNPDQRNKSIIISFIPYDKWKEVFDDEEMTQVKVLMGLSDDELAVRKNHAKNGEWIDITMRKVNILLSMDEDADWQTYLTYINIGLKFVEEQRNVRGTLNHGLHLVSSSTTSLVAYSDVDWAGCPATRRLTYGDRVLLGNNLLSWFSKRQPTLFRTSAGVYYGDHRSDTLFILWNGPHETGGNDDGVHLSSSVVKATCSFSKLNDIFKTSIKKAKKFNDTFSHTEIVRFQEMSKYEYVGYEVVYAKKYPRLSQS